MPMYNVILTFVVDVEKKVRAKSEAQAIRKLKILSIKNRKIRNKDFRRLESSAMEIGD